RVAVGGGRGDGELRGDAPVGVGGVDGGGEAAGDFHGDAAVGGFEVHRLAGCDVQQFRADVAVRRLGVDGTAAARHFDGAVRRLELEHAGDVVDPDVAVDRADLQVALARYGQLVLHLVIDVIAG